MPRSQKPSKFEFPKTIKVNLRDEDFKEILLNFHEKNQNTVLKLLKSHFFKSYIIRKGFKNLRVKPTPANINYLLKEILESMENYGAALNRLNQALEPCIDIKLLMDDAVYDELNGKVIELKNAIEKVTVGLNQVRINGGFDPEQAVTFASELHEIYNKYAIDKKIKNKKRLFLADCLRLGGFTFPDPIDNKTKFDEHFMQMKYFQKS